MSTLEDCQDLAEELGFKIEPAGARHSYEAALLDKPKPRYVLKTRHPTYDIGVFWNVTELTDNLNRIKTERENVKQP